MCFVAESISKSEPLHWTNTYCRKDHIFCYVLVLCTHHQKNTQYTVHNASTPRALSVACRTDRIDSFSTVHTPAAPAPGKTIMGPKIAVMRPPPPDFKWISIVRDFSIDSKCVPRERKSDARCNLHQFRGDASKWWTEITIAYGPSVRSPFVRSHPSLSMQHKNARTHPQKNNAVACRVNVCIYPSLEIHLWSNNKNSIETKKIQN